MIAGFAVGLVLGFGAVVGVVRLVQLFDGRWDEVEFDDHWADVEAVVGERSVDELARRRGGAQ